MSKRTYPYPEDEFDAAISGDTPDAAHRERRSAGRKWVAPVLVVVIAAALGYGLAMGLPKVFNLSATDLASVAGISDSSAESDTASETAGTTGTPSADDTASGDASGSPSAADSSSPANSPSADGSSTPTDKSSSSDVSSPPPATAVDKTTKVRVLNATNTSGLAAKGATKLRAAGWTNLVQDNYRGSAVSSSVVYYKTSADEAAAQAVAEVLGVTSVTQVPSLVSPVSAVLSSDFSG